MADDEDFMSDGDEDFDINALITTSRGSDRRRRRDRAGGSGSGSLHRTGTGSRERGGGRGECERVADLVRDLLEVCQLLFSFLYIFFFRTGRGLVWFNGTGD